MESMSDTTNETVQQGDRNSLTMSDISDDIIDVLAIDLSDNDTWLIFTFKYIFLLIISLHQYIG